MELEETIKYYEEVAEANEKTIAHYKMKGDKEWLETCEEDCLKYIRDHRQIAEWLKKLQAYENENIEADEKKQRNNVEFVCDIFDEMNRDEQIKVWQYVNEIMEGE